MPLLLDVPNLSPEKFVRVHTFLRPVDYLRTPLTIQEDLANGHPNLDCHPSFCFGSGFSEVIRSSFLRLVRHFALGLDLLKTNPANVDVEDEMLPELVDNPGTTRGAKLTVLYFIVFPSLVNCGV